MTVATLQRPMLSLRGVRKVYGGQVAVDGVDLDIAGGEFIALLGPSGCGKTTLLRCIAGLATPSAGDIILAGQSILPLPVYGRGLGMVFQSYALFPHMTVAENVAFGLRMRRVSREETKRRVEQALELVRLQQLEMRYPHQLSGGQQQRVAVARAIVVDPKVLLLDEPLAALDAKLREAMQVELRQLQRRLGVTAIFVTHDQQEALGMADRVAVMREGRLEQIDSPAAIYDTPRTPFVAEFIGQTNRFAAKVIGAGAGEVQLRVSGHEAPLTARCVADAPKGARVIAMLRPERLDVFRAEAQAAHENRVAAVVKDVLFSGDKVTVLVDTPLGMLAASIQNKRAVGAMPAAGEAVVVGWSAADMLIFPERGTCLREATDDQNG